MVALAATILWLKQPSILPSDCPSDCANNSYRLNTLDRKWGHTSLYILKQHIRVVAALVVREMQARFGNKAGGYAWAIIDPFAHVLTMTLIFSTFARIPPLGNDFSLFFASGFLPFAFYQGMSSFIAGAVRANKSLFSYPVVSPIDAAVARYILQLITSVVVTVVVLAFGTSELSHLNHLNLGSAVASITMASLLGLGIGLINIAMFEQFPLYEKIFSIVNRPLYMLSGVILLPDSMPGPIQHMMLWNPLVHVVMWFRQAIYPEYTATGFDGLYVLECAILLVLVGLYLFTASRVLREDRI